MVCEAILEVYSDFGPGSFLSFLFQKICTPIVFTGFGVENVDVNEQNPDAKFLCERMDFKVFKCNELESKKNALKVGLIYHLFRNFMVEPPSFFIKICPFASLMFTFLPCKL